MREYARELRLNPMRSILQLVGWLTRSMAHLSADRILRADRAQWHTHTIGSLTHRRNIYELVVIGITLAVETA